MENNIYCIDQNVFFGNGDKEDKVIYYSSKFNEYGIPVFDGKDGSATSYISINNCPWCGKLLPESRRDEWFETLEKLGHNNPFDENIPHRFKTSEWYAEVDIMKDYKIYEFYDTDYYETQTAEYDIVGNDYKTLIETCCKYCKTFSLIATNKNSELLEKLKVYEVPKSEKITFEFAHYSVDYAPIKYYKVSPDLCQTILANTNNIFCWINGWGFSNPEDPTFYREDGSVFFTSTIHDGNCVLMVKDEDVSEIISDSKWLEV